MTYDIRWKQRFQNFDRAFLLLRSALEQQQIEDFNQLEQEGLIQRFEYTFELAWKTMKDYLEESGILLTEQTPRAVIKAAFAAGILKNGDAFIPMMLTRNLLSHRYDLQTFQAALVVIKKSYLNELQELHLFFIERMV